MIIQSLPYQIKLEDAKNYSLSSTDNIVQYEVEYFQGNINEERYHPTSKHGIRVFENEQEVSSAIVCETGGGTGIQPNSAIVLDTNLFICCCNKVYCLSIPDLELKWKKRFDPATCFGVFPFKQDLIIYGELQITRVGIQGDEKWTFGARDIFVSEDGSSCFSVKNEKIYLSDWQGYNYVLDENGKEIKE